MRVTGNKFRYFHYRMTSVCYPSASLLHMATSPVLDSVTSKHNLSNSTDREQFVAFCLDPDDGVYVRILGNGWSQ